MTVRDDFSASTKRTLAHRVGHRCSNPGCEHATSGPAQDESGTVNLGVGAHITAASPAGPRYDASLSPEERGGPSNGIWLCQSCAKLIDSDTTRFTTAVLREWKAKAVETAFKAIATRDGGRPLAVHVFQLDEADRAFLRSLALPPTESPEQIALRMRVAAANDVAAFRRAREWPRHTVSLNLTLHGAGAREAVSLDGLAGAIAVTDGLSIISPPGTGKSTTLVQLAERILATDSLIPILIPLGEWSDRSEPFFDFAARKNAFGAFTRQHFMQAAFYGQLALLLDGWNELDPDSRVTALRDLKALRRDYPLLSIVIGTRRQAVPVDGPVIEIQPLSEEQQLELGRALRGNQGEALVDQAWRTPGVRELIAIPLYLTALLSLPPGSAFPQTKEEVLRMFVAEHERSPEQAAILHRELHDFHPEFLSAIGTQANRSANTAIPAVSAYQAISAAASTLVASGQLAVPPQPPHAIDVLIGSHVLVRSGADAVSFQHQQFQEWYASHEVEKAMRAAASGDEGARKTLREDYLNWPAWEESVLFACERVSREGPVEAGAVASAIKESLRIDPMLAADMIYRSAREAWPHVRDEAMALTAAWHRPGTIDRAVRFMIVSGRPEFAEFIWPLLAHEDSQIHLRALRAAPRFRTSVLGAEAQQRLAALPEAVREHVVAEIASNSGFDGMELAVAHAKGDQSPGVVVQIVQALAFRRGERHVAEILQVAPDAVWQKLAEEGYPETLADNKLNARLAEMRAAHAAQETDPVRRLGQLIDQGASEESVVELIGSDAFVVNEQGRAGIHQAFAAQPRAVAKGLLLRVGKRLRCLIRRMSTLPTAHSLMTAQ